MKTTTRTEGILPALETAHAIAALPKLLAGVDGLGRRLARPRAPRPARLLRPWRQGPRRPRPASTTSSRGSRRGDRSTRCARSAWRSPGTHEKETWGDAEHAGHPTFRVRDKIYVITGRGRLRRAASGPTMDEQADAASRAFPDAARSRRMSGGSAGSSVDFDALDPGRGPARDHRGRPGRRTAPKAVVADCDAASR